MAKHSIPILVTFVDTSGTEFVGEALYEGDYDWGHVIAGSVVELAKAALDKLSAADNAIKAMVEAGALTPIDFRKSGDTRRFVVNGAYDGEGGPYGEAFEAVDEADATLQAFWAMAQNNFEGREDASLTDMVWYMGRCSVFDATPEPVPAHEQRKLFVDLVEALRGNGGDVDEALAKAEAALVAMGEIELRAPAAYSM